MIAIVLILGKLPYPISGCFNEGESIPTYLEDYNELYLENPREANLTWFLSYCNSCLFCGCFFSIF